MLRHPSLRSTVTTLAAATVLVGGADLASYAATGNPLVLGHANSADGTTSLRNAGRGPALSLNNIKSAPPLVVNSSTLVKHLNADTVHGVPASVLAPKDYQITLAKSGNFKDEKIVQSSVPAGTYQITLQGAFLPSSAGPVQCYAGDKRFLTESTPSFSNLWAIYGDPNATTFGVTINAVGTAVVRKNVKVFFLCTSAGKNRTILPIIANFTQVNGHVRRPTTAIPTSRNHHALPLR